MISFLIPLAVGTTAFAALKIVDYTEALDLDRRWLFVIPILLIGMSFAFAPLPSQWTIVLLAILTALAVTDLKTQLLPDWLTGLFIATGLLQSGFALPTLFGAAILIVCAVLNALITSDEGMLGSADYLLCAGLIAWLGPLYTLDALIITLFIFGLQLIISHRKIAALAPALSIGLLAIWLKGPIL
jgi:prepilin signal peptidase PulO-like enzyme (type II secretory pathway)